MTAKTLFFDREASLRVERARAHLTTIRRFILDPDATGGPGGRPLAESLDFVIGLLASLAAPIESICVVAGEPHRTPTMPNWLTYSRALDVLTCRRCGVQLEALTSLAMGDEIATFMGKHAGCGS